MKLLLDQNISFRVAQLLKDFFNVVNQVKTLNLIDATDSEIWNYALLEGYTIVTFDSDFIDLATLKGSPPKVIWLRFGNSSNLKIFNKLIANAILIETFIEDNNSLIAFLEID